MAQDPDFDDAAEEAEESPPFDEEEEEDERIGQVLDNKYRLTRKMGEGGMGSVYEGVHSFVGRRFAIKFLHPWLAKHPEIIARFKREAQSAGSLESDNIVAITDFGTAPDRSPYIVMEYLDGLDLGELLERETTLPQAQAVDYLLQACRGLAVAHDAGIVHRDLKPDNLFIEQGDDGFDRLKIVDFGIAKLRKSVSTSARTQTGALIGTLLYMPPEQIRGDQDIDERADIYALGCILYEALSGRPPHESGETHVIIHRVMNESPVSLRDLKPRIPAELVEVTHRAMAFGREDRYSTVREFAKALSVFAPRRWSEPALAPTLHNVDPTMVSKGELASKGEQGASADNNPQPNRVELKSNSAEQPQLQVGASREQLLGTEATDVPVSTDQVSEPPERKSSAPKIGAALLLAAILVGVVLFFFIPPATPQMAAAPAIEEPIVPTLEEVPAIEKSEPAADVPAPLESAAAEEVVAPPPQPRARRNTRKVEEPTPPEEEPVPIAAPAPAPAPKPVVERDILIRKKGSREIEFDRSSPYE